ncbi:ABC transporter substrate-binding protein [Salirhabdus salicampi]|uniref:ABC transporter substrate-binding protein n=1 Tax=Salirhabdus salicampi TaxID=476102 RepID=UPI0020C263A8|nr:ABC transporter substrate-binding protein [Salirhabdus salicampi]MCP8617877.1 ABC transporter substrate-binding protein [Salirhabdus salicampi]
MKKILGAGIFALSLLGLTACGGNSGSQGDEVEIQYWHMNVEEERVEVIKDIIAGFEEENPGITVKQVPIVEGDYPTKISAALGANQMPALLEAGVDTSLLLGEEEVVETGIHEDIINDFGKDDFFQGTLDLVESPAGDGYYGVPFYGWVQGVWYRKDIFEANGLEAPNTWENILTAAKTLHDPDNKKYGIVIGTQQDEFAEQVFSQFALSNNANVFDSDGNVSFDSPAMIEALEYYKDLAELTPPGAETWREAKDLYLAENTSMVMYSSYLMGALVDADLANETGFATPENLQPATFGQITSLTIPNTVSDEEKEAAKKFVNYVLEEENYIKYLHMSPGGQNPTRASIAEAPEYVDNEVLNAYGEESAVIASGLENLQRFGFQDGILYPSMGDISAKLIVGEAIFNMTQQDASPKEVAEKAQQKMEDTVN